MKKEPEGSFISLRYSISSRYPLSKINIGYVQQMFMH